MSDPYQILGVSRSATDSEIKNAYRALAKKYHPDLNPGNAEAEKKFKEISHAYDLILNAEARAKFDRGEAEESSRRRASQQGPYYYQSQQDGGRYSQSFEGSFEGSDFFENLFRSAGGSDTSRGWRSGAAKFPGKDHLYHLEVDFRDAALGADREIALPNGKKLLVKIPAGIDSGAKLRFKGQGGPGINGGPPGNAFVEITVKDLPGFKRKGKNIVTELPLTFQEAILGAEVKVPTLEGNVLLKIPPGSSTGARLRIRGKGAGSGSERGDQIVSLKIVLPKKITPELKKAVEEMGTKFSYDPRREASEP